MLGAVMFELLYMVKLNTTVKFILVGDHEQLGAVEKTTYDYYNSQVLKELVDGNIQRLTVNKRSDDEMWSLYNRIDELGAEDFGECSATRVHVCYTNSIRKEINAAMMEHDMRNKKRSLKIAANPDDSNSQDVRLNAGTPVMVIKNCKKLSLVNGAMYRVMPIVKGNPLEIKDVSTGDVREITDDMFQEYLYVCYCTTVHKCQGETFNEPYTTHEWSRMSNGMKYTAISNATKKSLINVAAVSKSDCNDLPDSDYKKLKKIVKRGKRAEDPLYQKRNDALAVIQNIVRKGNVSDEYCCKHAGKTRDELLQHLKIRDGVVPKGYEIDHIKKRSEHVTDKEFENINAFWNLRLLTRKDNNERNWKE